MAENAPRPVAMDPPHITEFASDRYFEKLKQLKTQQERQQQHQRPQTQNRQQSLDQTRTLDASTHDTTSSPFILPLREYKAPEVEAAPKPADQKREKSRFFSIRHKVSLLHSKPAHAEAETVAIPQPQIPTATETRRKR
jgi:hypothetical protein